MLTPDLDVYVDTIGDYNFVPLVRNSPFPAGYDIYPFGVLTAAQLADAKRQAAGMVQVLGEVPPDEERVWVISEPMHAKFGNVVDDSKVTDPALCVTRKERGILEYDGEEIYIERIAKKDLDEWRKEHSGGGDLRLLGLTRDSSGRRHLDFQEAVHGLVETKFDDFRVSGRLWIKCPPVHGGIKNRNDL